MTTRVTIKCEGPDRLLIRYYAADRSFKPDHVELAVGESVEVTVHDGNLPVMWPLGHATTVSKTNTFFAVPPATWG